MVGFEIDHGVGLTAGAEFTKIKLSLVNLIKPMMLQYPGFYLTIVYNMLPSLPNTPIYPWKFISKHFPVIEHVTNPYRSVVGPKLEDNLNVFTNDNYNL